MVQSRHHGRGRAENADSRQFKVWGNRTYAETIRLKDQFPKQYQILSEMDPQNLGGKVPTLELNDLQSDSAESKDLPAVGLNDGAFWYRFRTGSE
ncbi:hypothetical protein [Stieleria magnilauensis]|uniref:Uncharacterized protein n=1 Tax=Stieleria magnilauensis TaxID=2527963 RepID=A0ABX5XSG0_9BACT|nr:hypothetical protein TBK1r_38970 [Planctomycetes bacterium TBK1r]